MANIIDLGQLENAEYMRRFQLLQSFMRPYGGTGQRSELEKVLDQQDQLDLKREAQARLLQESQARQAEAQASQALKTQEFGIKQSEEARAAQAFPLNLEKLRADISEINARTDLSGAQKQQALAAATAEYARAGHERAETAATNIYADQSRGNYAKAQLAVAFGQSLGRAATGGPVPAADVTNINKLYQAYTGDPHATVPMNQDGSLDTTRATPTYLTGLIPKESNIDIPTMFAANKPANELQENLAALTKARANGDTGSIDALSNDIVNKTAPDPKKIDGVLERAMLLQGDPNFLSFVGKMADLRSGKGETLKEPPEAAGKDFQLGLDTLNNLDTVSRMRDELVKGGRMPSGGVASTSLQKFYDLMGTSDPGVKTFQSAADELSSKYTRLATGVATGKMGEELKNGVLDPYTDTPDTFAAKLPIMRENVLNMLRTNMGYLQAQGYRIPDVSQLGPGFQPISPTEAMARWGMPDPQMPGAQRMQAGLDAEAQNRSMAESIRRAGTLGFGAGIAGVNQFRGQVQTPAVAGPTKDQVQVFRSMIKDPRALTLFDQYFPRMTPQQQMDIIQNKAGIQ